MDIRKHYYKDEALRRSFNRLAQETFGLDFEDWYQNGYWKEKYIPYSVIKDGEVIANVSVNLMDMQENGVVRHLIQLGTVMTKEAYRNQGLIRMLMHEIETDYAGSTDGMYLFANDSVLDFYPKFGYLRAVEYQYVKQISSAETADKEPVRQKDGGTGITQMSGKCKEDMAMQPPGKCKEAVAMQPPGKCKEAVTMQPPGKCKTTEITQIPMGNRAKWKVLEEAIRKSRCHGRFVMSENTELVMFYVTKFMQDNVFYDESQDAWVIAEPEKDGLLLHALFSEKEVDMDRLIRSFGANIRKVTFGFTPMVPEGYDCRELRAEDTTLFVKGDAFAGFEGKRLMFPLLSHA